jgi:hypothetical protein
LKITMRERKDSWINNPDARARRGVIFPQLLPSLTML